MAATLEIHFLTLKYTHCQFCQNYPKKVTKIKLILAKLAFATNYEVWVKALSEWALSRVKIHVMFLGFNFSLSSLAYFLCQLREPLFLQTADGNPLIKLKLGLQVGGGLLIADHLDQSL